MKPIDFGVIRGKCKFHHMTKILVLVHEISLKYNPEHIAENRWLLAIYKLQQVLQFGYEVLFHFEIALDGFQPS